MAERQSSAAVLAPKASQFVKASRPARQQVSARLLYDPCILHYKTSWMPSLPPGFERCFPRAELTNPNITWLRPQRMRPCCYKS